MEARTRRRLVSLTLVALLAAGVVYALVLHPGPDLRPKVESFLRKCDADQVTEAFSETSLLQLWSMHEVMEWSRFRRGTLGDFEGFASAEPLERVSGPEVPTRRMHSTLRFTNRPDPVACVFTFVRGAGGWQLSDFDIPLPGRVGGPRFDQRAKLDGEELARTLASSRHTDAYGSLSRQTRRATRSEDFESRMGAIFNGLGPPTEVRALSSEPHGAGMRTQVEVTFGLGAKRVIQLDQLAEEGHWRATTIEVRTP